MPRKIVVEIACDKCGTETDDNPDTIMLNRKTVELDLCEADRALLREALEPYLSVGRRPSKEKGTAVSTSVEPPSGPPCTVEGCTFVAKTESGLNLHKIRKHDGARKTSAKTNGRRARTSKAA